MAASGASAVVPIRRRPTTWLAVALLALALGMVGFMFASAMLPGHEVLSSRVDSVADLPLIAAAVSAFLALTGVGAVLAVLRPRSPIGWILLVGGIALTLQDFVSAYVERSTLVAPLPGYQLVEQVLPPVASLAIPLLTVWLPLLFPDGRLPGPRWRVVGAIAAVYTIVAVALTLVPTPEPVGAMVTLIAGGLIAAAVVALIVRFRRTHGTEHQQVKWFLSAVALLVAATLVLAVQQNVLGWALMLVAFTFLPIAIGIAVLRYRLYEIDRIISRTIGWAIVTGLLAGAFVLLVIGWQAVLSPLTGGSTLAVAGSTLVVAALFSPVRSRVQRAVDRRFDRSRYDGERLLADFGERLRDEVDLPTISREARQTVDAAVRPASVGLWLRGGSEGAG